MQIQNLRWTSSKEQGYSYELDTSRNYSRIELVLLIIHAYNNIINKRRQSLKLNILMLITYDMDP
jgi:hypothetical protein